MTQKELEEKILYYSEKYYSGNEEISDAEFDELIAKLKQNYPDSELINNVTETSNGKLKHKLITGTLAKCANEEEFREWFKKHPGLYNVSYKCDGLSQECIYEHGVLVSCISRGDGFTGENCLLQISKIPDVPKKIDYDFTGSIRGEVILFKKVWKEKYSDTKNPRNCAAGLVKHLDGAGCEDLNFIAYDVLDEVGNPQYTDQLSKKFSLLEMFGFKVPEHILSSNLEEILQWREEVAKKRDELEFEIDGIVAKNNITDNEDLKRRCPTRDCAIKFSLSKAASVLRNIEWQLSGSVFSPVAVFDPVELDGTTVTRASLANLNKMNDLNIDIGDKIVVAKAGQIIPVILEVIKN